MGEYFGNLIEDNFLLRTRSLLYFIPVFVENHPARSCFAVGKLPLGATVEIEAVALTGDVKTEYINVD